MSSHDLERGLRLEKLLNRATADYSKSAVTGTPRVLARRCSIGREGVFLTPLSSIVM
jgi:predicted nucleotidyltransferase